MLQIKRVGPTVVALIDAHVPDYEQISFSLTYKCEDEVYAAMLRNLLANTLAYALVEARQEAYRSGYMDGKKGEKRQRDSSRCI